MLGALADKVKEGGTMTKKKDDVVVNLNFELALKDRYVVVCYDTGLEEIEKFFISEGFALELVRVTCYERPRYEKFKTLKVHKHQMFHGMEAEAIFRLVCMNRPFYRDAPWVEFNMACLCIQHIDGAASRDPVNGETYEQRKNKVTRQEMFRGEENDGDDFNERVQLQYLEELTYRRNKEKKRHQERREKLRVIKEEEERNEEIERRRLETEKRDKRDKEEEEEYRYSQAGGKTRAF